MYERIGVAQVVEELVAQAEPLVRPGDQPGDVEELYGYGPSAVDAGAVVGFASIRDLEPSACAVDLEVAYGPLGVDGCESEDVTLDGIIGFFGNSCMRARLGEQHAREVAYCGTPLAAMRN